jgi:hypothetical protein
MDNLKTPANQVTMSGALPAIGVGPGPQVESSGSPFGRSPIGLQIHGDDVFLSGTFHRWQATASSGPDLDLVSVHMAVDATSPDQLTFDPDEHKLFAFSAKKLTKLGNNAYSAEGTMTTTAGERAMDVLVEIPEGHNSFFALAFVARKEFLGESWGELIGRAGAGGIDAERLLDPRAALRTLELAVA